MKLEPVLHPLAHDVAPEPDADVAAAERLRLRRLDFMAGAVGLVAVTPLVRIWPSVAKAFTRTWTR